MALFFLESAGIGGKHSVGRHAGQYDFTLPACRPDFLVSGHKKRDDSGRVVGHSRSYPRLVSVLVSVRFGIACSLLRPGAQGQGAKSLHLQNNAASCAQVRQCPTRLRVSPFSILNSIVTTQFTSNLQKVLRAQRIRCKCLKRWPC